jgi:hypothetical protein
VGDRVYPIHPPPCSSVVCLTDPLAPLAPPVLAAPPLLDLVPPCCSSDVEPLQFLYFPRRHSPSPIAAAQRLGPVVESQDPCTQLLLDGVVKRANRRSIRLPHELNRSCGVSEPDGPTLVDGSIDSGGGGGVARVGEVGEGSGDGSIRGTSGPWGRPLGPMVMRAIRWTADTPTGPVTTVIRRSSTSSSLPSSSP